MVPQTRRQEVETLIRRAAHWAAQQGDIRGLLLVGSWARGEPRPDSDVDLVLLTDQLERYLDGNDLIQGMGAVQIVRKQNWGAIEERRLQLPSGLELEVGLGQPSWAATDPLDPGTRRVVRDGALALYDPDGLVAALVAVCLSRSD